MQTQEVTDKEIETAKVSETTSAIMWRLKNENAALKLVNDRQARKLAFRKKEARNANKAHIVKNYEILKLEEKLRLEQTHSKGLEAQVASLLK